MSAVSEEYRAIDQARIAALVAAGLGKAGAVLGSPYQVYRPTSAMGPISGTPLSIVTGTFSVAASLDLLSSDYHHQNEGYFVGDMSGLLAGDLLVGDRTWFVSHIEALRPAVCCLCNRVVVISTPAVASAIGSNAYGGSTAAGSVAIASGWPASVLASSHVEVDPTKLPSDTRSSYFEIRLAAVPGVLFSLGMLMSDDVGQNYTIQSAEYSECGWRLMAGVQTT